MAGIRFDLSFILRWLGLGWIYPNLIPSVSFTFIRLPIVGIISHLYQFYKNAPLYLALRDSKVVQQGWAGRHQKEAARGHAGKMSKKWGKPKLWNIQQMQFIFMWALGPCSMMKLYNGLFQERAGGREKAAMEERLEKMQKEVWNLKATVGHIFWCRIFVSFG